VDRPAPPHLYLLTYTTNLHSYLWSIRKMVKFNEYIPKGGWVKYRRRQELKERLKAGAFALLLLGGYALCGYLERGC
jgi:hypothetical protein